MSWQGIVSKQLYRHRCKEWRGYPAGLTLVLSLLQVWLVQAVCMPTPSTHDKCTQQESAGEVRIC